MEEKERYELFGEYCIKDNNPDARCQLLNTYQVYVILNEQDKRIKELEEENLSLQEQSIRDNQNWVEETTRLKQQLRNLPKNIVEEIKLQIFNHFNVKNMEEYESLSMLDSLFTADAVTDMLDDILKEYQK